MTDGDCEQLPGISFVVIGRNEGDRLVRCLESIHAADYPADKIDLIYVDTDSTDGSCERAEQIGARVVRISPERRSAATARNAGFELAKHELVHFLDGDTILDPAWLKKAVAAIAVAADIAIVFGRRDEIDPSANVYHFCMHHDWYVPPGKLETCGGDILIHKAVLRRAGGYDPSLIAGEERDLCCRIVRDQGLGMLRLDEPMTLHDINMTRFSQYWRRCFRSGYAYAQVAARYQTLRAWRRTCNRNILHAATLVAALGLGIAFGSALPIVIWTVLIAVGIVRNAGRCRSQVGSIGGALVYSLHHYLSKIPTVMGHLAYYRVRLLGARPVELIEYQHRAAPRSVGSAASDVMEESRTT